MYISSAFIDVKLNQDYSEYYITKKSSGLIICDGIGEFVGSRVVAELVVKYFLGKVNIFGKKLQITINHLAKKVKLLDIKGGTTFIRAIISNNSRVDISYLGNGGIIRFAGDFATNPVSSVPYRYSELMFPDITPSGELNKHISHISGNKELNLNNINLNLNNVNGDILLFYSDGISSLENNVIVEDENNNLWRNESLIVQYIIKRLHEFLKDLGDGNFQELLTGFNKDILEDLKKNNYLEDDASLGIIITEKVLEYYKGLEID